MTSQEKRFEKIILGTEKYYRFEDIRNFLEFYGYTAKQTASSHITFRRKNCRRIVIVIHHNHVYQVYVKRMIKALKENKIL